MGKCPKADSCSFFHQRMPGMPTIAALFKKRLCEGDNTSCARYYLFTHVQSSNLSDEMEARISELSINLYPNELARVKSIIG